MLFEYWHYHMRDFKWPKGRESKMVIPSLSFLSSEVIIDTAAASIVRDSTEPVGARFVTEAKRTADRNSGATSETLQLRPLLTKAGFDVSDFSDRYIETIRATAKARAAGMDVFAPSTFNHIVDWVQKNVFEKGAGDATRK